jgi:putative transposase
MMALRICVQRFERLPQTIIVDNGKEFHSHYFEQLLAAYVCTKKHRPPATARFGSIVERLFGTANTQFVYELQGNTQLMKNPRQVTQSVNSKQPAAWTLDQLYMALCEWAYQIYDQREHPALGQSPRDAFNLGLTLGGQRVHRRVVYDELFHILTLPAPVGSTRKVQPGRGVKIHNIYYWSNDFRDPEVEQSSVEVRYDPFDIGIAYAFVRGHWVQCISNYYAQLKGRSEKELHLISAELYQRKRQHGQNVLNSDNELVQFLSSVEATEEQLILQRLKAVEHQRVIQLITNNLEPLGNVSELDQTTLLEVNKDKLSNKTDNDNKKILVNISINLESEQLELLWRILRWLLRKDFPVSFYIRLLRIGLLTLSSTQWHIRNYQMQLKS